MQRYYSSLKEKIKRKKEAYSPSSRTQLLIWNYCKETYLQEDFTPLQRQLMKQLLEERKTMGIGYMIRDWKVVKRRNVNKGKN
jgi:hypothetical protein